MNQYNIIPYIRYSVYRKCPLDWRINPRVISDHEFVLIHGGEGWVTIEGKTHEARQGTLFYFHPELLHSMKSNNENPLSFYAVHFSFAHVGYADNRWRIHDDDGPLPIKTVTEAFSPVKLSLILKELNSCWGLKSPGYELKCNGLFQQFLFSVLFEEKQSGKNYSSRMKVNHVMEYIADHLDEKLTVHQLAAMVNLSPDYLSNAFKAFTGYPLSRYMTKIRIETAKSCLCGRDEKIKDAARQVGFKDEFHFSKVFKKYEGMSPQAFRETQGDGSPVFS